MSLKSEHKKATKAQRQAEAEKLAVVPPSLLHKWYAEDAVEFVEDHRKHCTDPNCDNRAIALSMQGQKMVAKLYPQKMNEIFLALYGTNTDADYQPFMSLQLANPEDIRGMFDANGNVGACEFCGHDCNHESICLTLLCHREGVMVSFEPDGTAAIRCKVCGNAQRCKDFPGVFRLASRPKVEWPNIFCSAHGIEPRYLVCRHVLEEGKPPAALWAPDAENPGVVVCENCEEPDEKNPRPLVSVCQSGLNAHFHGRLKEMLAETGQSLYVLPSTVLDAPSSTAVN